MKCGALFLSLLLAAAVFAACDARATGHVEPLFLGDKVISQVITQVMQPIADKLNQLADSIRKALHDNASDAVQRVHQILTQIAELLEPRIMSIFRILNEMGLVIHDLEAKILSTLTLLLDNIKDISRENAALLRRYVNLLVSLVSSGIRSSTPPTGAKAYNVKPYLVIDRILGAIISRIFTPLAERINERLDAIRELISNKVDNAKQLIDKHLTAIVEILRPSIIQILLILKDMGVDLGNIRHQVKATELMMIEHVKAITEVNKQILRDLVDYVVSLILGEEKNETAEAYNVQPYLVIDRIVIAIINRIITPLAERMNKRLDAIRELISNKVDNAKQLIDKQLTMIVELLRPHIIRIIGILNDLGVDLGDLYQQVKTALLLVIKHVKAITEVNKQVLRDLVDYVVSLILGKEAAPAVRAGEAAVH